MSEPELLSNWKISVRCWNALYHGDIITVDDLKRTDQESLLRIGNFGKVSLAELMAEAQRRGIDIPKRQPPDRRPAWKPLSRDYQPEPDPLDERIQALEARVAELEALLWGRMAA